jgi:sec-independent protein translocase protein TatB
MFDIGWSELLLVAVLAIIFVGPKDLPRMMRTVGQYTAKVRRMAREFQTSFEDMARESELDELRREVSDLRQHTMQPLTSMKASIENPAPAAPQADEAGPAPRIETGRAPDQGREAGQG